MGVWANSCKYYQDRGNAERAWCSYEDRECWLSASFKDADKYCDNFELKSGCFMTSACVDYMGKEDDCVELETLRKFRDTKLKKYKCGQSLINEYYLVAPSIVESIEKSPKKDKYYQDIYDLVCQCVDKVNENKDDEAIDIYLRM